jgi:hypothetical protein
MGKNKEIIITYDELMSSGDTQRERLTNTINRMLGMFIILNDDNIDSVLYVSRGLHHIIDHFDIQTGYMVEVSDELASIKYLTAMCNNNNKVKIELTGE